MEIRRKPIYGIWRYFTYSI